MELPNLARRATVVAVAAAAALAHGGPELRAQDVQEQLERLAEENGSLYVKPLTDAFGTSMNQGMYHTATVHETLGFDIGIAVAGSLVPDENDIFNPILPDQVTYRGQTFQNPYGPGGRTTTRTSPAVTGEGPGTVFEPQGQFAQACQAAGEDCSLRFPEGLDIPGAPFAVIQGSVGLIYGTELTARFVPDIETTDEVGKVSAFGLGVKHSVSQYIPASPVSLAVHAGFQNFDVGDYLSASASSWGVLASKGFGPLELLAGADIESSSVDVEYTFTDEVSGETTDIGFSNDLDTSARLRLGATLNLLALKLAAQYSVGEYDALAAKAMISVR